MVTQENAGTEVTADVHDLQIPSEADMDREEPEPRTETSQPPAPKTLSTEKAQAIQDIDKALSTLNASRAVHDRLLGHLKNITLWLAE